MSEKAFCETCRKMVDYKVEYEKIPFNLKRGRVELDGMIARCAVCNDYVNTPETEQFNYESFKRLELERKQMKLDFAVTS